MDSLPECAGEGPAAVLSWFRREFYACLTARKDEIFEMADAVLCCAWMGRCGVWPTCRWWPRTGVALAPSTISRLRRSPTA